MLSFWCPCHYWAYKNFGITVGTNERDYERIPLLTHSPEMMYKDRVPVPKSSCVPDTPGYPSDIPSRWPSLQTALEDYRSQHLTTPHLFQPQPRYPELSTPAHQALENIDKFSPTAVRIAGNSSCFRPYPETGRDFATRPGNPLPGSGLSLSSSNPANHGGSSTSTSFVGHEHR